MRSTAAAPRTTMSHRRDVISHSNALRAQPTLHLAANRGQPLGGLRLVACNDDGLRVRGADESPAVAEQHADAVDVDDVVPTTEILHRFLDEPELELLRNVDAELWSGHERWHVGQSLRNGAPRIGENAKETRGAVHRVVVSVEAFAEE